MIYKTFKYTKLNLGCGNRFLNDWTNVDFFSRHPSVLAHDLLKGIPFEDHSFDVVYHSHVLEHFSKKNGIFFLKECYRVLKPNGIIRVVVPDLKQITQEYLKRLHHVVSEESAMNQANYDWSVIELFDQMVREESGGEMMQYWMQRTIINEHHIASRMGFEFTEWRSHFINNNMSFSSKSSSSSFKNRSLKNWWKRYWLKKWGISEEMCKVVKFNTSGERHKWMYDEFSLRKSLINVGFKDCVIHDAYTSSIEGWSDFVNLDVNEGAIRKPDSIFMEARKIL